MKYNVGDRVRIKSINWYNKNKDKNGYVDVGVLFDKEMSRWCGKTMTIIKVNQLYYTMEEDGISQFFWTDEMIECKVEEENKPNAIEEAKTYWDNIKDAWICPEGYIFKDENGNVINATKIVLEKKKKEYPKSYKECCDTLYRNSKHDECYEACLQGHPMQTFAKLLICRDAYWKIAGEEMGLGKPWKPDWTDLDQLKYCIWVDVGEFITMTNVRGQHILAFPTEEMRDAFYENFKELIEFCKEFL